MATPHHHDTASESDSDSESENESDGTADRAAGGATPATPAQPDAGPAAPTSLAERFGDPKPDPQDVFRTLIRDNPGICDTCFRRIRDYAPAPSESWFATEHDHKNAHSRVNLQHITTDRVELGQDGEYAHPPPADYETDTNPWATRPERGRIICEACGHVDRLDVGFGAGLVSEPADHGGDAALTLSALKRALDRCIERVREQGYTVAEDAAFDAATHLKTDPDTAKRDADIVAVALTLGLRRGSHTTTATTTPTTTTDSDAGRDHSRANAGASSD